MDLYKTFARPALFRFDPEFAHHMGIKALASGLVPACSVKTDPRLAVRLFDVDMPNPLGIAAGFDKNGEAVDGLFAQGFGFVEVGTVTPRPQAGNPRPRLFRLPEDQAVINRFGFNNEGHAAMLAHLKRRQRPGPVLVNVGANKDSADRVADYVAGVRTFAADAALLSINVSSPNTPGLRDLQARDALAGLLDKCLAARDATVDAVGRRVPVFIKIAPDLDEKGFEDVVAVIRDSAVDGVIVSNTTVARDGLSSRRHVNETGGLSGRPLFERSTALLARTRLALGPDRPLIGVGGVDSGEAAFAKILAGATLVQVYSGLIYEGLSLIARILDYWAGECDRRALSSISEAVGLEAESWAEKPVWETCK